MEISNYNNYNSVKFPDANPPVGSVNSDKLTLSDLEEIIDVILQDSSLSNEEKYRQLIDISEKESHDTFVRIQVINSNPYLSRAEKKELISNRTRERIRKRLLFAQTINGLEILPPSKDFMELLDTLQLFNKHLSLLETRYQNDILPATPEGRAILFGDFVADLDAVRGELEDLAPTVQSQIQAESPLLSPWQKIQLRRILEANEQIFLNIKKQLSSSS